MRIILKNIIQARLKTSSEKGAESCFPNFSRDIEKSSRTIHLHRSTRSQENLADDEMIARKEEMREMTWERVLVRDAFLYGAWTRETREQFLILPPVPRGAEKNPINSEKIARYGGHSLAKLYREYIRRDKYI